MRLNRSTNYEEHSTFFVIAKDISMAVMKKEEKPGTAYTSLHFFWSPGIGNLVVSLVLDQSKGISSCSSMRRIRFVRTLSSGASRNSDY